MSRIYRNAKPLSRIRHADVVVANIEQIAGAENRWLDGLEADFFDLVLVDEAHHNPPESWQQVKRRFQGARIGPQRASFGPESAANS